MKLKFWLICERDRTVARRSRVWSQQLSNWNPRKRRGHLVTLWRQTFQTLLAVQDHRRHRKGQTFLWDDQLLNEEVDGRLRCSCSTMQSINGWFSLRSLTDQNLISVCEKITKWWGRFIFPVTIAGYLSCLHCFWHPPPNQHERHCNQVLCRGSRLA